MKNILITTQHRGVFFAQVEETTLASYKESFKENAASAKHIQDLKNCRMAIYWGTTRGIMELCETGPTKSSKIGAVADVEILHDVTGVWNVTDKAAEIWLTVK